MAKEKKTPQRMCIGCHEMKNKKELVRIVKTPQGEIEVDITGKKAGRGAYICPNSQCLDKALKTKKVEKALQFSSLSSEHLEKIKRGWEDIVTSKS